METIAVWFSCGAASAVAAKKTIELYGNTHDIRILNNPVKEEDNERENLLPVLIDQKITKQMCFDIIKSVGIDLPRIYKLGYPNANCIGCSKATSVTYWNHVRKTHPDIFKERARLSREIGCRLTRYRGKRIFLDELAEDATGKAMKSLKNIECGIFCEERGA